jgi:glycosyltransferase involved in cell wall biosynthesis
LLISYGYLNRKFTIDKPNISVKNESLSLMKNPDRYSSSGPLRILLVTARYLPHVGGTEIHTYELANRLVADGHDVTVLTTAFDGQLPDREEDSGIKIRRVRAWPANKDYYFAPGIYSYITQGNWDVVHCQGYHTLVVFSNAALRKKIPISSLSTAVDTHPGGVTPFDRCKDSITSIVGKSFRFDRSIQVGSRFLQGKSTPACGTV